MAKSGFSRKADQFLNSRHLAGQILITILLTDDHNLIKVARLTGKFSRPIKEC